MELSTANTFDRWSTTERPDSVAFDGASLRGSRRYEVISELGGGAMSIVRLAHDSVTGRVVAIKSLASDAAELPSAQRRFAHEAAILERLRHPNIVETTAIEREGAAPIAIVTEYVRGVSLRDVVAATGALPIERVTRILRDVAAALAYVHARGIVHCDVKPANILLDEAHDRAVLIDFGIACATGARPDSEHEELTVGTPAYMAPEQIEARAVDARTDVYALCVVAWELLAGRMPWLGEPLADVLHRQRYESLPDLALVRPDIPVYLLNAINGGLAKDPARRWRDAGELLRHLSPRALSLASSSASSLDSSSAVDSSLDATMRIDAAALPITRVAAFGMTDASEAVDMPGAVAVDVAPRRRTRVLASTIGVAALLLLGSLAPRLSHATEHRPVSASAVVDPELDSMLTLAVSGNGTGAGTCGAVHCAPSNGRSRSARTGVRKGSRAGTRMRHAATHRATSTP